MRLCPLQQRVTALRPSQHAYRCGGADRASGHSRVAGRQFIPSSTTASSRDRRSIDNDLPIHASPHPASILNQTLPRCESIIDSDWPETALI